MSYFLFFLGFVVLILGASWLVDSATALGRKISRIEGSILIAVYIFYLIFTFNLH